MSRPDGPRADVPDPEDAPDTESAPQAEDAPDAAGVPATGAPAVSRRKIWLFSIAAVVVLVVAGVVVYLVTKDDAADTAGGPAVPTITDSNSPTSRDQVPPPAGSGTTATITAPPTTSSAPPAGDAGSVQSVAEQAATAITNADVKTLAQLSCDPGAAGEEDTFPTNAKVEVIGEPQVDGDTATINVRVTIEGAEPAEIPMPLTKRDGRWCIP